MFSMKPKIIKSRIPPRGHLLQISVLAMHQNGRDTHIRQVRIFGPLHNDPSSSSSFSSSSSSASALLSNSNNPSFGTGGRSTCRFVPGPLPGYTATSSDAVAAPSRSVASSSTRSVFSHNTGSEIPGQLMSATDGVIGFRQSRTAGYMYDDAPIVIGGGGGNNKNKGKHKNKNEGEHVMNGGEREEKGEESDDDEEDSEEEDWGVMAGFTTASVRMFDCIR